MTRPEDVSNQGRPDLHGAEPATSDQPTRRTGFTDGLRGDKDPVAQTMTKLLDEYDAFHERGDEVAPWDEVCQTLGFDHDPLQWPTQVVIWRRMKELASSLNAGEIDGITPADVGAIDFMNQTYDRPF